MKTILIVDDEPAARYGLRRALEAKYRIAEADSAEAATEGLPEQPDLVLLDVVLPGRMDCRFCGGCVTGRRVGADGLGAGHTKTAVEALQLGAADYLVKDSGGGLRRRVANLLKLATLEKMMLCSVG